MISYTWTPEAGAYNLTAKATTSANLTGTSGAIVITVAASASGSGRPLTEEGMEGKNRNRFPK
jgi:hypothetical protein